MDNKKITDHQLMAITAVYVCGASTIIISSSAAALAKQDAWISSIIAILIGLIVLWNNLYLGGLYPNKSFVEVVQLLLGKWIGGFIVLMLSYVGIVGAAQFVWYVGDFFTQQYMKDTPPFQIDLFFLLL